MRPRTASSLVTTRAPIFLARSQSAALFTLASGAIVVTSVPFRLRMLSMLMPPPIMWLAAYLEDATGIVYWGASLPLLLIGGRIEGPERQSIVRHCKFGGEFRFKPECGELRRSTISPL